MLPSLPNEVCELYQVKLTFLLLSFLLPEGLPWGLWEESAVCVGDFEGSSSRRFLGLLGSQVTCLFPRLSTVPGKPPLSPEVVSLNKHGTRAAA